MFHELELETHPHLPSGEWSGFYCEDHRPRRGWMHLYLNFCNGTISGEGTDYVGPWHVTGTCDIATARCSWVKQYLGKHSVSYEGSFSEQGIRGFWNIRGCWDGPFHIWPSGRTDLATRYLQEEMNGDAGKNPAPGGDRPH